MASARWEHDMEMMRSGMDHVFNNELDEAEKILKQGMLQEPAAKELGERDLRGAFGMAYALVSLIKGVATFADDQLKDCEARLKEADRLANLDSNWTGKKVVRGICTILLGVIQLLQGSLIKGIYNIMRSWGWIHALETEGLHYEGKEAVIVRSASLFTLGTFYLLLGLLPPSRAASAALWISGFHGDRGEGAQMLQLCWKEGGLMAGWAALVVVAYHVDTKTFIGEPLTDDEKAALRDILDWANSKYPKSLFFSGLTADFVSVTERNVSKARKMTEVHADAMGEAPALKWVLNYKLGVYELCSRNWEAAGDYFTECQKVYMDVGRRSMVPYMASFSMLSYLEAGKTKKAQTAIETLARYKEVKKRDWGRQDIGAFKLFEVYRDKPFTKKVSKKKDHLQWPLLHLVETMVLLVRNTWWMDYDSLDALLNQLLKEEAARSSELKAKTRIRVALCAAEIYRQTNRVREAIAKCREADALESDIGKSGKSFGAMPMIHYIAARTHFDDGDVGAAKMRLSKIKHYGADYDLYMLVHLKASVLARSLGEKVLEYDTLEVPAGSSREIRVDLTSHEIGKVISWSWIVQKRSISFSASFVNSEGEKTELESHTKAEVREDDDVFGGIFTVEQPGELVLIWDNSFSMFRSKTIMYSIAPESVEYEIVVD